MQRASRRGYAGGYTTTLLDPWVRTHERLGAWIVEVPPRSVTVPGTVAEWRNGRSSRSRERDEGIYVEPNVWMVYAPRSVVAPMD